MNEKTELTDKKQTKKPWLFKKGESGNPEGRPKGSLSITGEIKKKLEEIPENQKKTYLEILITKILKKAIVDEDQQMIKNIWNYVDGLPKGTLDIGATDELKDFLLKINKVLDDDE